MKAEQIQHFRDILLKEKADLETDLAGLGKVIGENGDWIATPEIQEGNEADFLDQADLVEEYESKIGRLGAIETRYQEVIRALERIDAGTYGICIKSGVPIEEDRLEANPAAETCKAMMNTK